MICPIMPIRRVPCGEDGMVTTFTECQGSNCAWYDSDQGQCAVLSININLLKGNENA